MEITTAEFSDLDGAAGVSMAGLLALDRTERAHVHVAELAAGSSLPKHPAGPDQVFYVISGEGDVAGDDDVPVPVGPGSTVRWPAGEQHTSWARTDMTVLIIQHRAMA